MPDKRKCFIIMPITTPRNMLEEYSDRDEHFKHILDHLFVPAVEKADYIPVPPKVEGAEVIHGEIVNNIEGADIVLCDMSCLNPNVFFELGIRTALNKAVCLVKDDKTKQIPFDTTIINCQDYASSIQVWNVGAEIDKLVEHVKKSDAKSKGENVFWKYFGMRSKASPYETKNPVDAKLDYLGIQVDSLAKNVVTVSGIVRQLQTQLFPTGPTGTTRPGWLSGASGVGQEAWLTGSSGVGSGPRLTGDTGVFSSPWMTELSGAFRPITPARTSTDEVWGFIKAFAPKEVSALSIGMDMRFPDQYELRYQGQWDENNKKELSSLMQSRYGITLSYKSLGG